MTRFRKLVRMMSHSPHVVRIPEWKRNAFRNMKDLILCDILLDPYTFQWYRFGVDEIYWHSVPSAPFPHINSRFGQRVGGSPILPKDHFKQFLFRYGVATPGENINVTKTYRRKTKCSSSSPELVRFGGPNPGRCSQEYHFQRLLYRMPCKKRRLR